MTAVADRRRRQALRRAVLRRVVVPDVPQGRAGRQGHHDAGQADLAAGRATSPPRWTARQPGMAGICLRGQPGWGQVFAPLTTVVNTFGGTWFEKDWTPQVNAPEFTAATQFYVDLVRDARRGRRAAGRLHRVPEQPGPGQRRDVVRRDHRRRLARGRRLPGQGQDRLRRRAGRGRPRAPAGCTPGPGASSRPARRRTTPGSSSPGRPARSTRNWSASSSAGPGSRPASAPRRTRTRTT